MSNFELKLSEVLPFCEGKKSKDTNGKVSYNVHFEGTLTKESLVKLIPLGLETLKRSGAGITMYFKPTV